MNSAQNKKETRACHALPIKEGTDQAIKDLLRQLLEKGGFDALLIPAKVPETNSFSWVLLKDKSLLDNAVPIPPVMTVQGGTALSSVTKHGNMEYTIAALMRPCEIQAAVELSKMKQIDLENIVLIGIDCPGALPLSEYMTSPDKSADVFKKIVKDWKGGDALRPVCRVCHRFSLVSELSASDQDSHPKGEGQEPYAIDLHIGLMGGKGQKMFLIPVTSKGRDLLSRVEIVPQDSLKEWEASAQKITKERAEKRKEFDKEWQTKVSGHQKLIAAFDECINCHNCMRVCPVCYCQQCYFDSQIMGLTPSALVERAEQRASLRFPLDTLNFHLGRMSHMVLSCVSCGACEDACPMSIPVSQIFSMVGDRTQKEFDYLPGRERSEPLPLQTFKEEEFCEVETPGECEDETKREAEKNV